MLSLRLLYPFYWTVCLIAFLAQGEQLSFRHHGRDWLTRQQSNRGIRWRLPIEENGPIMEFYGSLQSVEAQIRAIKHGFGFQPVHSNHTKTLNKRDKILRCLDDDVDQAQKEDIQNGIAYLRGLGDDVMCGDRGGSDGQNCGAIYCVDLGAIKWCNQGEDYFEMPCNKFADFAQDILDKCSNDWVTHGVEWDLTADHDIMVVVEDKGDCP